MLVATVPLCWVFRVLQGLPEPLILSHGRWPLAANLAIVLTSTATTAVFIRRLYYSASPTPNARAQGLLLVITALVYIFAFVLLIRQYVGLYPEYFVAAGPGGFTLRKRLYQNIVRVEEVRESHGETEVLFFMKSRERLTLGVPTRDLALLYSLIERSRPEV